MRGNTQLGRSYPAVVPNWNRRLLRWRRSRCIRLRLLGDDLVLHFVVSRLRDDLLMDQIQFRAIRTSCNDFLRVGVADAEQSLELIGSCGVDVELGICRGRSLYRIHLGYASSL